MVASLAHCILTKATAEFVFSEESGQTVLMSPGLYLFRDCLEDVGYRLSFLGKRP